MSDDSIISSAISAAPKDYVLAGSQEFLLKAVRAVYDGSGAAGAYLPTFQLLDANGNVMFDATPTGSVAAGASAVVSWFPGLGGGGGGGIQTLVGARIEAHAAQSVSDSTNTNIVYDTVAFDTGGMANLGSDNRILTATTTGYYLVTCATTWSHNNAGRRINGITHNGLYASGAPFVAASSIMPVWDPFGGTQGSSNLSVNLFFANAGDTFASGCFQASGAALNCNGLVSG